MINNSLSNKTKTITDSKSYDSSHVFIIENPIMYVVMLMILDKYNINHNRVHIAYLRKSEFLTNGMFPVIDYNEFWFDKYITKFFRISLKGKRIRSKLNNKKQSFILYTNHASLALESILDSRYCKGHIYIEEGQISYWKDGLFSFKNTTFFNRMKEYYHDKRFGKSKNFYRDDAKAFIGITADAFPEVPKEKRHIIDNYDTLKKYYKPKLLGVKTIGLTCAERRIQGSQWKSMLESLVERMPEGGVIKLHPSFSSDIKKVNIMKSLLEVINPKNIKICDDDVIIEIEMLYDQKIIIGPLTSLSIYADAFGSNFEDIKLY